ncbi:hypothetical protein GPALN_011536 [Globodera pallida]|nr:hypothetical protein GPALN_011536 [Globodera pallida]
MMAIEEETQRPRTLDTEEYVRARVEQIAELLEVVDNPALGLGEVTSGPRTVFQRLPRHMRRRAMSHNLKRLPRALRPIAARHTLRTAHRKKPPSRKWRRRPSRMLKLCVWLETHIWHAKRFHLTDLWGYKLALKSCQRGFRPNYRCAVRSAIAFDQSYLCCLQFVVSAPISTDLRVKMLSETLSQFCQKKVSPTFAHLGAISGRQEVPLMLFSPGKYPNGFLGPARVSWATDGRLSLWVHPAMERELLAEMAKLPQISVVSPPQIKQMEKGGTAQFEENDRPIKLVNLRNRLCRFHLIGPKAIAFLRKVIRLVSDDELDEQTGDFEPFREMHRWWRDLPANDPRLFRAVPTPPQQQQYNDQHRLVHPTSDDHSRRPPPSAASLFSDWQFFHQNLLPKRLTHSEFETLCAGKLMRPRKTDFKIPISIVFRRISIPSPSIKNFALNCVDLICPSGVGYDFWLALQFGGFRAIGIHDKRALDFEAGIGTFPDDCADCCAGELATQMEAKSLMEKFERKPCNRRVPYGEELNVAHPFTFEWDKLLAEWSSSNGQHRRQQKGIDEEANKLPFFILRDRQALKRLDLWLRRSRSTEQQQHSSSTAQPMLEECFGTSSRDSVLVPVFLRMKRRGVPKRLALISLPTDQDLQLLNGSAAAEHGGGDGGDRMVMNSTVIIREEARKSRRQNGMDGTSTSAEDDDDDEEEEEEDRKAASSSSARHIPEFISLSQHEQQRGVAHFFPSVEECEQQLLSLEAIFPDGADDKDRRRKARNVRKRVKKRAKMISNRKEAAAAPEGGGEASGGGGPSMEMQMEIGDESERQPTEEATRKLIGRVVRGDYAFTSAQGMALGFVPLGALEAVVRTGGIVLVRNTSSKYYHPAQLHIHSVEQNI